MYQCRGLYVIKLEDYRFNDHLLKMKPTISQNLEIIAYSVIFIYMDMFINIRHNCEFQEN